MKVGIIGLGFVGSSIHKSFEIKGIELYAFDKFKNGGIGNFSDILNTEILFLCLPTQFNLNTNEYDKDPIYETCERLVENNYQGVIIIKSTIEPNTTNTIADKYKLQFIHNPEFLTAKTAFEDFHNQKHIVLGQSKTCSEENLNKVVEFYRQYYPEAEISLCSSLESECMKMFCNNFYAVKVQVFNEFYALCNKIGADYNNIRDMMLKNNWVGGKDRNPLHTIIPGPDGQISFGNGCFVKDLYACTNLMKRENVIHAILESCLEERNKMRDLEGTNVIVIRKN